MSAKTPLISIIFAQHKSIRIDQPINTNKMRKLTTNINRNGRLSQIQVEANSEEYIFFLAEEAQRTESIGRVINATHLSGNLTDSANDIRSLYIRKGFIIIDNFL